MPSTPRTLSNNRASETIRLKARDSDLALPPSHNLDARGGENEETTANATA